MTLLAANPLGGFVPSGLDRSLEAPPGGGLIYERTLL